MFDFGVIGGGIVGLATALRLQERFPDSRVLLLEKERELTAHQTGNNSGVIHSGLYYRPGSAKARFCLAGNRSMVEFCATHGIPTEICGKLVVACDEVELKIARDLYERGVANQVPVEWLSREAAREVEPHVECLGAIRVPSTGIVSYRAVGRKLAELIAQKGGVVELGQEVTGIDLRSDRAVLTTASGAQHEVGFLVNCGGLHSDRLARKAGADPKARIVPFRGEYYELVPQRRSLVKALIYPVPNPKFPFLGVHYTRMIDGGVHCGPNAVLSLAREGYTKWDVSLKDCAEVFGYSGFWRLARKHFGDGMQELWRSFSKAAFVESLQRLIPEIRSEDLVPCRAGVRAQALAPDGKLVDDFLLVPGPRSINVCNAPSPAATASLEIAKEIVSSVAAHGDVGAASNRPRSTA